MIRLLVLDVDGTMTDGGVYYDSTGNELKKFAIKDGAGIVLAHAAGMQVMICTGRECEAPWPCAALWPARPMLPALCWGGRISSAAKKAARALCAARWKRSCCGTAACLPPLKKPLAQRFDGCG